MDGSSYKPPGHNVEPVDTFCDIDLQQLQNEFNQLDPEQFPMAHKILQQRLGDPDQKVPEDPEYLTLDVYKPIRISKKVIIPTHRNPNFNYVGKIIGTGGATLKALAANNKCRVFVCGKGTTKDPAKEQSMLATGDPKYAHYANDIQHVKIETIGGASTAYSRITSVLQELERTLATELVDDGNGNMVPASPQQQGGYRPRGGGFGGRGRGRGAPRMPRPPPPPRPPMYGGYAPPPASGNGYDAYAAPAPSYDYSAAAGYDPTAAAAAAAAAYGPPPTKRPAYGAPEASAPPGYPPAPAPAAYPGYGGY